MQQKDKLLQKHRFIYQTLLSSSIPPLDYDLEKLKQQINNSDTYNIYITDENFIIKNTTFKNDYGFNLSFAKELFYKHKKEHTVGISTPIYEKSTKQFFSYSDEFIPIAKDKEGILQVSYTYTKISHKFHLLKEYIATQRNIIDAKAYLITDEGFVTSILLHDHPSYKPSLAELQKDLKTAKTIKEKLTTTSLEKLHIQQINDTTQHLYIATQSPVFSHMKIFFSLIVDQTPLQDQLFYLTVLFFILIVAGAVGAFFLWQFLIKEKNLHFQNTFLHASMHELKTPLSVITLNNELRENIYGSDRYTQEIKNATKLLKTTYEDLHWALTNHEFTPKKESIDLCSFITQRVEYFKHIIITQNKHIKFSSNGGCSILIAPSELERLIDNNLTNTLKYSHPNTTIEVFCEDNRVGFITRSNQIHNTKRIFERYYRENDTKGGHGLGLWIVTQITRQNGIKIDLTSTPTHTTFTYTFKCDEKNKWGGELDGDNLT